MRPPLMSCVRLPLMASPPAVVVTPLPLMVPPLQVEAPLALRVPVPPSVPPERPRLVAVIVRALLMLATPPPMASDPVLSLPVPL